MSHAEVLPMETTIWSSLPMTGTQPCCLCIFRCTLHATITCQLCCSMQDMRLNDVCIPLDVHSACKHMFVTPLSGLSEAHQLQYA